MTNDDIIRMAREAGYGWSMADMHFPALERFARLVAAAAVKEEREACARVLDEMAAQDKWTNYYVVAANAIRARGEHE
jgi:hypothetical protein